MRKTRRMRRASMFAASEWSRLFAAAFLAALCSTLPEVGRVRGAETAVPRKDSGETLVHEKMRRGKKIGEVEIPVYREMTYKGMTVRALAGESEQFDDANTYLRIAESGAFAFINRAYRLTKEDTGYTLPAALTGQPALITNNEKYQPYVLRFSVDQPARIYAHIDWHFTLHPNRERGQWKIFRLQPYAGDPVYYRDVDAGTHELHLRADPFVGVGMCPLDALSPAEKIVPIGRMVDDRPVLRIGSDYTEPRKLSYTFEIANLSAEETVKTGEGEVTVAPQAETDVRLPVDELDEGIMYTAEVSLRGEDAEWDVTIPFGLFPVPKKDASVEAPIFPYGGYLKLNEINSDPELFNRFLAATFYHFRRLGMNVCMVGKPYKHVLDTAHRYGIKTVVGLASRFRPYYVTEERMRHPAILTYKIGDEPIIGSEHKPLSKHVELLDQRLEEYPQYKPFLPAIYDGYGRGDNSDPNLIYNHYLKDYDIIRAGRLYCFQKRQYGLLRPIAYKPRLEVTSIFLGLEADERPWWLIPQFFGASKPAPVAYWRVPSGTEMRGLLHLAVSHRCTGILGWGVHTHGGGRWTGLLFDGKTMAITRPEAYEKLAGLGEQLTTAKPVLQNFTRKLLQVHYVEPKEVDVHARWLKSGQIAIYCVNRDIEDAHAVRAELYLGDELRSRKQPELGPRKQFENIRGVSNIFTGAAVPFEYLTVEKKRFGYLGLDVPGIAPGDAALLLVSGKQNGGRFADRFLPENVRQHVEDAEFIPLD